ncbi:MAG: group 1 truncated hemoglobin [Bdellovibrionaceae bacterium]|jgi:hemoglobin|nr:group 1 truncated hemoglobin [Pseudobdellovibrionaceae bacterium]
MTEPVRLYDKFGGDRAIYDKVVKIFYDEVFKDPWIGQFFEGHDQEHLEKQQADFMIQSMGGPRAYSGKFPKPAHQHMLISDELFEYRHEMLDRALKESGASDDFRIEWMRLDSAFKKAIVKTSHSECEKRYNSDTILDFPNPGVKKAA